jgi:hypothetical protein
VEKGKFLTLQDSNFDPSVVQPVASRYTDCAIPAPPDIYKIHCADLFREVVYKGSNPEEKYHIFPE